MGVGINLPLFPLEDIMGKHKKLEEVVLLESEVKEMLYWLRRATEYVTNFNLRFLIKILEDKVGNDD